MHSVNLDLLQTTPHHASGTPRDPHAHHRADHRATFRAERRKRRHIRLQALAAWLRARSHALAHLILAPSFLHKYPGVRGSAPGPAPGTPISQPRP